VEFGKVNRTLIEIVAGILLFVAFVAYERHRGAEQCIADNKAAVHEQDVHNAQVHGGQVVEVKREAEEYKNEIARPVAPAPVVRLCPRPRTVPATSPAGPVDHDEAEHRKPDPELPAVAEWNSEPVVRAGRDADAQIKVLEEYINNGCQKR
jgi:hypothetical protein